MRYMVAELLFTAKKAWYENGMICMLMSDNKEIRFPVATNKSNIEIICGGTGLHWPDLDEDLSVTGIIEGRYGQ